MVDLALNRQSNLTTYVVLLRGINVGRTNRISMSELRTVMHKSGYVGVKTYLQSGNLVLRSAAATHYEVKSQLEELISTEFRLLVTVLVRSAPQMIRLTEINPFLEKGYDSTGLHVTFLDRLPDDLSVLRRIAFDLADDEFQIVGSEIFLSCPNGYHKTKLSNGRWEKLFGTAATTRNWNTVVNLASVARLLSQDVV